MKNYIDDGDRIYAKYLNMFRAVGNKEITTRITKEGLFGTKIIMDSRPIGSCVNDASFPYVIENARIQADKIRRTELTHIQVELSVYLPVDIDRNYSDEGITEEGFNKEYDIRIDDE